MKKCAISFLDCPCCGSNLDLKEPIHCEEKDEIKEGILDCQNCDEKYLIKNYIVKSINVES